MARSSQISSGRRSALLARALLGESRLAKSGLMAFVAGDDDETKMDGEDFPQVWSANMGLAYDQAKAMIKAGNSYAKKMGLPEMMLSPAKGKRGAEDDGDGTGKRRKKAPKDPNRPKRAPTSYLLFCAKRRAENPDRFKGGKAAMTLLGEEWAALSAEAKKPFEAESARQKVDADAKLKAYVEKKARGVNFEDAAPVAAAPVGGLDVSSTKKKKKKKKDKERASSVGSTGDLSSAGGSVLSEKKKKKKKKKKEKEAPPPPPPKPASSSSSSSSDSDSD